MYRLDFPGADTTWPRNCFTSRTKYFVQNTYFLFHCLEKMIIINENKIILRFHWKMVETTWLNRRAYLSINILNKQYSYNVNRSARIQNNYIQTQQNFKCVAIWQCGQLWELISTVSSNSDRDNPSVKCTKWRTKGPLVPENFWGWQKIWRIKL